MSVLLIAFIQSCGWPNSRVVGPPTKCQKQLNVKLGYISLATNFTVVTFPFYHVFWYYSGKISDVSRRQCLWWSMVLLCAKISILPWYKHRSSQLVLFLEPWMGLSILFHPKPTFLPLCCRLWKRKKYATLSTSRIWHVWLESTVDTPLWYFYCVTACQHKF